MKNNLIKMHPAEESFCRYAFYIYDSIQQKWMCYNGGIKKRGGDTLRCNFTPYEGKKRYIFVSYSHKDSEKVIPIMEYIAKKGYRLWYDEGLTPSSEWTEDIEQHIKHCYIFLALISRNAQESENCQDEIVFAKNNKKILMIVRLEDVELRKGLGLQLSRKQITDSFKYPNIEDFYQTLLCDPELKYCHASMTGQETSGEAYYKNKKQQADELEQAAKDFVRERNFIEAQKTYSEAASIRDELFSLRKGLQERKERYVCYESLADTMEFQENYADAYTYRNLALQDLECLAEHYSAAVNYEQKKYHKAIPYYEQQIRCMETLFEKYGNIEDGETLTQYYNRLVDFPRIKLRQRRQLVKFGITVSNKLYNRTQDDKYKNSIKWFEERNHPLKFLATYNRPLFCVFAVGIYVFLTKMIIAGTGILLRIIVKYNLTQDIYGVTLEHVVLTVFLTILVAGLIVYIRYCWRLPKRKKIIMLRHTRYWRRYLVFLCKKIFGFLHDIIISTKDSKHSG